MDIKPIEYTDLEKMLIQFHEDSMGIKYVKDYAFFLKRQMIEKACEWLSNHVNDYIVNDKYILPNGKMSRDWLKVKSEMFDDFRKYMKGE